MPKPNQLRRRRDLTADEIAQASYAGSPEHKVEQFWDGLPEAWIGPEGTAMRPNKQKTTICRKVTEEERSEASEWVRTALRQGRFKFFEGDKTYPKHIWHCDAEGHYWFGFAINQIMGTYKGWPITEAEKIEAFD